MSDKNPQICTLEQAKAAAKHLESAGLHVVQTFIPKGNHSPNPEDKYNKFFLFEMFNGAIVCVALVVTVIRNNPGSWRAIMKADITRPVPKPENALFTSMIGRTNIPTTTRIY